MNSARSGAHILLQEWGEYERRVAEINGYPTASSIAWAWVGGRNPPASRAPTLPRGLDRPAPSRIAAVQMAVQMMLDDSDDTAVQQSARVLIVEYVTDLDGVEAYRAATVGSRSQYDQMLGWGRSMLWGILRAWGKQVDNVEKPRRFQAS